MTDVPVTAAIQPDPTPATAPEESRVGRLLALVRRLIDYGRELAAALQRPDPAIDTRHFGTSDIALILARITRGLHRASALEERLVRNAARLDSPRSPRTAPATTSHSRAPRPAAQSSEPGDPRLALLPTAEQIAASVRRRPVGAVIADICRDLGIRPCHPLWRELADVILRHGGNLAALVRDILTQAGRSVAQAWSAAMQPAPALPSASHAGTGPP